MVASIVAHSCCGNVVYGHTEKVFIVVRGKEREQDPHFAGIINPSNLSSLTADGAVKIVIFEGCKSKQLE